MHIQTIYHYDIGLSAHCVSRHEISQLLSAQLENYWSNGPTKLSYCNTGDVLTALDNATELFDQVQ